MEKERNTSRPMKRGVLIIRENLQQLSRERVMWHFFHM